MATDRGHLKISVDAGFVLWYVWWVIRHPNRYGYMENFCHFVRSILLYAPLLWLFTKRVDTILGDWVRPWMLVLLGVAIAALGACFWFWPIMTLAWIIVITGFIIAVAILIAILAMAQRIYEKDEKRARAFLRLVTMPIWVPMQALLWIFVYTIVVPAVWFFTYRITNRPRNYWENQEGFALRPWMVALVFSIIASYLYIGHETVWYFLVRLFEFLWLPVLILLGALYALGLLIILIQAGWSAAKEPIVKPVGKTTAKVVDTGMGSLWIFLEWLWSLKNKYLCPYIEFVDKNGNKVDPIRYYKEKGLAY